MITGKEYLTQTSVIGVQRILSKFISLLYWILITSIFTLHEIGIIAILAIVVNISVPVTLLRLYTYAEYKISHSLREKQWNVIHGTILRTIEITLLFSILLGLGIFFVAKSVVEILQISTEYIFLIQMTGIAVIVSPFFKLSQSFFAGLIQGHRIALMSLIQPLTLLISGFFIFPYFRLVGLPIVWIISYFSSFLISLYFIRDIFVHPRVSPPLKEIFAYSLPLCLAGVVGFFSGFIDQILVLAFLGVEILGLYYLVLKGVAILRYLSSSLLALFFPTMCESFEYGKSRAQLVLSRVFKFVFTVGFPFLTFSSIVAFIFFSFIFFEKIIGGEIIFTILCIAFAINIFREILESVLLAAGYKNVPFQILSILLIIKIVFLTILLILFPTIDIVGIVYLIGFFAASIFLFRYFKKHLSLSIQFISLFKIILASGIVVIILFLLSTVFKGLELLLISSVSAVILYPVFISIFKTYNREDINFLKKATPKIVHPFIFFLQKLGRIEGVD